MKIAEFFKLNSMQKFEYNKFGACTNPNTITREYNGCKFTISTSTMPKSCTWVYGISLILREGVGFGIPFSLRFPKGESSTEKRAVISACQFIRKFLLHHPTGQSSSVPGIIVPLYDQPFRDILDEVEMDARQYDLF